MTKHTQRVEEMKERNLFETYLSKIITSFFEAGLVEREKRFNRSIVAKDLKDILSQALLSAQQKTAEEIVEMLEGEIDSDPHSEWIRDRNSTVTHCKNLIKSKYLK